MVNPDSAVIILLGSETVKSPKAVQRFKVSVDIFNDAVQVEILEQLDGELCVGVR